MTRSRKWPTWLVSIVVFVFCQGDLPVLAAPPPSQGTSLLLPGLSGSNASLSWSILVLLTVLTLIPALLLALTPFARVLVASPTAAGQILLFLSGFRSGGQKVWKQKARRQHSGCASQKLESFWRESKQRNWKRETRHVARVPSAEYGQLPLEQTRDVPWNQQI